MIRGVGARLVYNADVMLRNTGWKRVNLGWYLILSLQVGQTLCEPRKKHHHPIRPLVPLPWLFD